MVVNVIDYYVETWKNTPKEYNNSVETSRKKNLNNRKAIRKTKPQPIYFTLKNSLKINYNKRKLNELPNFIFKLEDNQKKLQYFKDYILFNYDFMFAKTKFKDLGFLNPFYDLVLAIFEERVELGNITSSSLVPSNTMINDLLVILYVFLINQVNFEQYPDALIFHLTSRLSQYSKFHSDISALLDNYKKHIKNTTLIAPYNFMSLDSTFKTAISFQKTSINRLIYCVEQPYVFLLTNYKIYLINYRNNSRLGMLNLKIVFTSENPLIKEKKMESLYM